MYRENTEVLTAKASGKYGYHYALKVSVLHQLLSSLELWKWQKLLDADEVSDSINGNAMGQQLQSFLQHTLPSTSLLEPATAD